MTKNDYLGHLTWIIPLLITDLILPIITFLPDLRKRDEFKVDAHFIVFIITVIGANCMISYIMGISAYIVLADVPVYSYYYVWVTGFIVLGVVEAFFCYIWLKRERKASIKISMSPNDYKVLILAAEKDAKTILLMPKRIHVMFKSEGFIHYLAEKRFGIGSEYIRAYEDEHIDRKAALYRGLNNGMLIRELHNKDDLISYITKKAHSGVESIEKQYFIEMLEEWKRVLQLFPTNYCVRLTDENLPLKYELIDNKKMIIHESVGSNSRDRLNALFIENRVIVSKINNDFSQIWERVPANYRNNQSIIGFIDTVLLPLLS